MKDTNKLRKSSDDLGEAAYIRMKGFKCVGRKGRTFYFELLQDDLESFEALNLEYINSPYHDFDACIMSLKKVSDRLAATANTKKGISDLGAAAYLKMHGFKCAGRNHRNFYFEIADEDLSKFDMLSLDYINSEYNNFDSAIMCLKKISEYVAD